MDYYIYCREDFNRMLADLRNAKPGETIMVIDCEDKKDRDSRVVGPGPRDRAYPQGPTDEDKGA